MYNGKSRLARHVRGLFLTIVFQMILIVWLSTWAVEDYLNNEYVRAYVDGTLQAYGLLMGALFIGGVIGSGWEIVHRRHKRMAKMTAVTSRGKGPVAMPKARFPAPTMSRTLSTSRGVMPTGASPVGVTSSAAVAVGSVSSASLVGKPDEGPKPVSELHPAVAALKAELSDRRMSLGLASATMAQEQGSAPLPRPVNQSASIPERSLDVRSEPRPEIGRVPTQPSTVIRPVQPPTVIRPVQPPSPGMRPMPGAPVPRPMQPMQSMRPALPGQGEQGSDRFEDAAARAGFQQVAPAQGQQPSQGPNPPPPAAIIPRNVTTVITGIMPAKKKDEDEKDQKSSSQ